MNPENADKELWGKWGKSYGVRVAELWSYSPYDELSTTRFADFDKDGRPLCGDALDLKDLFN